MFIFTGKKKMPLFKSENLKGILINQINQQLRTTSTLNNSCCCCFSRSVISDSLPSPCQAPVFMGFSRQGYWSGLPFPSPGK